jgi:hypothetical protein
MGPTEAGRKAKMLYQEETLARMVALQKRHAWDLEASIDWKRRIDLARPLVPLDDDAILFPGASQEERLAISQMMGLLIATCIHEMEECLIRLRRECWDAPRERTPISPEFKELGELFFEEELKHSAAFRRYTERYAEECGLEPADLESILPKIRGSKAEQVLRLHLRSGGQSFWWIVALVEQEFLQLYHSFRPFRDQLEPLYFEIHERHFEEEARHVSFPYLMIELARARQSGPIAMLHSRSDFAFAQIVQSLWAMMSLRRLKEVRRIAHRHPILRALAEALPKLESLPSHRALWKVFTSAPYVSSLVNPFWHPKTLKTAQDGGAIVIPFPAPEKSGLVRW